MNSTFGNFDNKDQLVNGAWERFSQAFAECYARCELHRALFVKKNLGEIFCKLIKQETYRILRLISRELIIFAAVKSEIILIYLF